MRLLVFGHSGQVARELALHCPPDWQIHCLSRAQADLSDPAACARIVTATDADVIINAAAYTAVDRAETEEALAHVINADAPSAMAKAAAQRGLPFLQISTDYVFDGSGTGPWQPGDVTAPIGAYGRTKCAGEVAVRAAGGPHAILRTSWVFSAHGSNFVKTMLRLGTTRDSLNVVADQIGGPTPARDIAKTLLVIAQALQTDPTLSGTYHLSGAPDVSWADFAREIFTQAGTRCTVQDIPSSDYPTPARRPANSRLDCSTLTDRFGITRPDWREGLALVLAELETA